MCTFHWHHVKFKIIYTSLLAYKARAVLTWYQQGCFPNFSCTRLQISWTVHSRGVLAVLGLGIDDVLIAVDFPDRGFFSKMMFMTEMWHTWFLDYIVWVWDPTLGLINDVWAPWWPFLAATLSQVWVLRFVYFVFPIRLYNDHKYSSPPSMKTLQDEWLLLGAWPRTCYCTGRINITNPNH